MFAKMIKMITRTRPERGAAIIPAHHLLTPQQFPPKWCLGHAGPVQQLPHVLVVTYCAKNGQGFAIETLCTEQPIANIGVLNADDLRGSSQSAHHQGSELFAQTRFGFAVDNLLNDEVDLVLRGIELLRHLVDLRRDQQLGLLTQEFARILIAADETNTEHTANRRQHEKTEPQP